MVVLSVAHILSGKIGQFCLALLGSSGIYYFGYILSKRKFILLEDRIISHGRFSEKEILFSEIELIRLDNATEAIQVYHDGTFWPDISVYYGVGHWRELARELVDRVPPDVEVSDAWGVLETKEE